MTLSFVREASVWVANWYELLQVIFRNQDSALWQYNRLTHSAFGTQSLVSLKLFYLLLKIIYKDSLHSLKS